jgi:hypothetical protein
MQKKIPHGEHFRVARVVLIPIAEFFIPISFIDFFVNVKLLQPHRMDLDCRFEPRLLSGFGVAVIITMHGIRARAGRRRKHK